MPGRCFLALELPAAMRGVIAHAALSLRSGVPRWQGEKWVDPELYHVTVVFLGDVEDPRYPRLESALAEVAADTPGTTLRLSGCRAVPTRERADMIWATLEEQDHSIASLRDRLLSASSLEPDRRALRPHVTIVRARRPRTLDGDALCDAGRILSEAGKVPDGSVSVPSLTVFSSTLGPGGPRYERLAVLPFRNAAGGPFGD